MASKLSQLDANQNDLEDDDNDDDENSKSSTRSIASKPDDLQKLALKYYWLEVYLEEEKTWISVDPFDLMLVDSLPSHFEKRFNAFLYYNLNYLLSNQ